MRLLLRLLALFALAVAVIMAVVDVTQSIVATEWVITPLGETWQQRSPGTFTVARQALQDTLPLLWDPAALAILAMPGWAVFAVLALILHLAGHRRRRRDAVASFGR